MEELDAFDQIERLVRNRIKGKHPDHRVRKEDLVGAWKSAIGYIRLDDFWRNKSIVSVAKNLNEILDSAKPKSYAAKN